MSGVAFDSRKNYLKIFDQDSTTMNRPATLDGTYFVYYTEATINHNLGYTPIVRAWYSPSSDNTYYPVNGQKSNVFGLSYHTTAGFTFFIDEITATTVRFRAERDSGAGSLSGTFTFYYKIYVDPTL